MLVIGINRVLQTAFHGMRMWWTKLRGPQDSSLALNYFLRDLVRFHGFASCADDATTTRKSIEPSNEQRFALDPSSVSSPDTAGSHVAS